VNAEPKQILVWLAVVVGFFGVALSYFAIYVLAAYFAAGLVWYANLALAISGPIAGGGAIVARKKTAAKTSLCHRPDRVRSLGFTLDIGAHERRIPLPVNRIAKNH
jgi:hypothetical protein